MKQIEIIKDPRVKQVFKKYPSVPRKKLKDLRALIMETAKEIPSLVQIEETLKWGELSYITKYGSTLRIDWKERQPDQYAIYFKCTSLLVPTFKKVFGKSFNYEGSRALIFGMDEKVPRTKLKKCIRAALEYHKVKRLPNLGLSRKM